MTPAESGQVALELERLRGTLETGFARVDGALALLVQRSDQTDRALDEQGTELRGLEKRVDVLEADVKVAATHGPRLSAVERVAWTAIGVGAVAAPVGGWLLGVLVK
ncbi:hypothetical protein OG393_20915 [Streptomyces sp. NBC_01216]|uniref:hypothetical protein n=1 Tax=Streptomyces sp. NBC_01216 TaxID=2903778 RepID=UPI002E1291B6|nr:hypothetical protein OG393_20915 [Streptomyces sp. NBC_01216]